MAANWTGALGSTTKNSAGRGPPGSLHSAAPLMVTRNRRRQRQGRCAAPGRADVIVDAAVGRPKRWESVCDAKERHRLTGILAFVADDRPGWYTRLPGHDHC